MQMKNQLGRKILFASGGGGGGMDKREAVGLDYTTHTNTHTHTEYRNAFIPVICILSAPWTANM